MKYLVNLALITSTSLLFTGCILTHPGCIKNGKTTAMECGRYADRFDAIERYNQELKKFNVNVDVSKLGKKLSDKETEAFSKRFCKRHEGKVLPVRKDIAADFAIHLGDYYKIKFCNTHQDKKELGLYEKETRTSVNYGYITWYISDGKKVYDFRREPITYFKSGIKFGTATFAD